MFEGAHTALVTPFKNREFDEAGFRKLIDQQFDAGVSGIVPCGTTGESPTLSNEEHRRVIEVAIDQAAGRGLVIPGTGSNSTREAIAMTQFAEQAGADGALLVCPYYNKPSQEGLFQHHKAIAESTSLPLVLYSIPGRCVIEITVETQARLHAACPNIRAMKEAGGKTERVAEIRASLPETYEVVSGDDGKTLEFMAAGAVGVISVATNLTPSPVVEMVNTMRNGDRQAADKINAECAELFGGLLSLETNPVPIKEAMAMTGMIDTAQLRLPLVPLDDGQREKLREILASVGIL